MSDEVESPFAVLDTPLEAATGDSAEATPAEAKPEEAPAEAKAEEKPESEGEERKAEEPAKPEPEPETKDGEKKADEEAEEPEPIEGEPPKLKEFISKHKLTGEEKRWLKKEVYTNREYRDLFPDIREAKDFRSAFPASEDWQGAVQARDAFFRASEDFEQNPSAFAEGLKATSPEAYQRFAEIVAGDVSVVAQKVKLDLVSEGLANVFSALKAEAVKNGVPWDQVTAKEIEDRIFSGEAAPKEDPRIAQILEENRKLKAAQAKETQKSVSAVTSLLDQRITKAIATEVKEYVDLYAGDGFTEAAKAKIVSDLTNRVNHAFKNTASNTHAKKAAIEALKRNQIKPNDAVASLAARARPELKRIGPDVIRNWTDVVIGANKKAVQKAQATKTEQVSATRDVPQMATPPPAPTPNVEDAVRRKDKRAFWDAVFAT